MFLGCLFLGATNYESPLYAPVYVHGAGLLDCWCTLRSEVTFVLFNWNVRMEQLVHFGGTAQREICVPILIIHIGAITFL